MSDRQPSGAAHLIDEATGDRTAELYGRGGQLLATTTQMAYFKR